MISRRAFLAGALVAGISPASGWAQGVKPPARVALLIGNASYEEGRLRNPVNDVRAVANALGPLGFTVVTRENLKLREMLEAMRDFLVRTRGAEVRLFYFAGHGVQLRGRNYLLPVDARLESETDVLQRTADATELIEQLSAIEHGANVIVIDACRVPPALRPGTRRMWAVRPGMSAVTPPAGTLVAFSTRPGKVARDGEGNLSVYTRHFARELAETPELSVESFFKRVRSAVVAETKNAQVPWESSDLTGELCFRPGPDGRCRPGD